MRIALCDDDKTAVSEVLDYIKKTDEHHIIDIYYEPHSLLETRNQYDVMFLDIDMPNMNGIELGNAIRKKDKKTVIVYLTNMSEYRSMAFGVHAFDYLDKPISEDKIRAILLEIQSYKEASHRVDTISFTCKEGIIRIPIQEILYFEFSNRHVKLYTIKQTYTLTTTLYKIRELVQDKTFISPHKSFYINLEHVRLVKGYDIYMVNDDVIPLSQKRASEFRVELHHFLRDCLHKGGRI